MKILCINPNSSSEVTEGIEKICKEYVLRNTEVEIKKEMYLGITIDKTSGIPIIMVCSECGIEIEEVSHIKKFFKNLIINIQKISLERSRMSFTYSIR